MSPLLASLIKDTNPAPAFPVDEAIHYHNQLKFEYAVLRALISQKLPKGLSEKDFQQRQTNPELKKQIEIANQCAATLAKIYQHYLRFPESVTSLKKDQITYASYLGLENPPIDLDEWESTQIGQKIRTSTTIINWPRLLIVRVRRLIFLIDTIMKPTCSYHAVLNSINHYSVHFFAHLNWVFFLPRLIHNTVIILKQLIPYGLTPEAKQLSVSTRLRLQLDRRWFELTSDITWVAAGILSCFILIGVLSTSTIFVALALQISDTILATARWVKEMSRLNQIKAHYTQLLNENSVTPERRETMNAYLACFEKYQSYERQKLFISFSNTLAILTALSLTLPFFCIVPVIPIIGAALAVAVTVISFSFTQRLKHQAPPSNPLPFFANPPLVDKSNSNAEAPSSLLPST